MPAQLLAVLAFVLAGCAGGDQQAAGPKSGVDESKPMFAPAGPLRGILISAERPARGARATSALVLPRSATAVYTAIPVRAAAHDGAAVAVTWYRLTAEGRSELFSQTARVGDTRGMVVASASAPRGVAPGMYETVARLGDHQVRVPWFVLKSGSATRTLSGAASADGQEPTSGAIEWSEETYPEWGEADEGATYTYRDEFDEPSPPAGPCQVEEVVGGALVASLLAVAHWRGDECSTATLSAAVTGAPSVFASDSIESFERSGSVSGETYFCELPGGSDLPGTVVQVVGSAGPARRQHTFTLEDPREFAVQMESVPAAGSRVDPGSVIKLRAMAVVLPPSLGVRRLHVDDGDRLIASALNIGGSTTPRSCDMRRFAALIGDWPAPGGGRSRFPAVQYRVPDDAPPVIEICASGATFDGQEQTVCSQYYTGEVWEGTITMNVTAVPATGGQCGSTATLTGPVRLVVAGGRVTGTYDVTGPCVTQPHGEFTGTSTADAFHFPQLVVQTNGEPIAKVSATEARATLTNFQGSGGVGARWVTTWDLKCVTC